MAKFIKDIHDLVDLLTKKGKAGYHPRVDIDTAVYTASKDLFYEEYKLFEASQLISDSMGVFISDPTSLTLDNAGKVNIPTNYLHLASLKGGTSGNLIREMDEGFLANKLNDPLCGPTLEWPICKFYKTYIQFYPITVTGVVITYLKPPIKPVYAYTIVSGREVYDDTNSVDVEWRITDQNKVTMRTLEILGVNLSDPELANYAMVKNREGI